MTNFVNLTPHPITFVDYDDNPVLTVPASGTIARVAATTMGAGTLTVEGNVIPVHDVVYGEVTGLPDYDESSDAAYIVSGMVAAAISNRPDVYVPDDFVRDPDGKIIGARGVRLA